ncbi:MAG: ABC transporter permease, partial [Deltaproteobacteria bacterium]|nr:ABC transporter permease [Deltaproteobacteria bacterium]
MIFCVFGLLERRFLQLETLENIVKQSSFIGIVAVGITLVLLTGGIDLSVGSNMYLSAVVGGLLIKNYGAPIWVGLAACLLVGTIFGAINALAVTRLKIVPFVVTLSTLVAGRGIGLLLTKSHAVPFPEAVTDVGKMRFAG